MCVHCHGTSQGANWAEARVLKGSQKVRDWWNQRNPNLVDCHFNVDRERRERACNIRLRQRDMLQYKERLRHVVNTLTRELASQDDYCELYHY